MSAANEKPVIGVIGGSGVYDIDGLSNTRWERVESAFGEPSDDLFFGELDGVQMVFLPRHGRGHKLTPSAVNYRANIDAMKRAGCTEILSVSACGSLREDLPPGTFVFVNQFIDRTFAREKTFFGPGLVGHVGMGHPVCGRLAETLYETADQMGIASVMGGTYLAMEGPQFSTLAESELYRSWGCHVIGMTNMPEAKLAREAELCYATVAMVTDFDCWHPDHDHVSVDAIIKVLMDNSEKGRNLVRAAAAKLAKRDAICHCGCHRSLDSAIITAPEARDPALVKQLDAVAGRVLHDT